MKTSKEWWEEVKNNPTRLLSWLRDQFYGETMAAKRLIEFSQQYSMTKQEASVLKTIAKQESDHASWVGTLLTNRGESLELTTKEERYWNKVIPSISSFPSLCGAAAHAEEMRLERIKVIVNDLDAPKDIRDVFSKILPQEVFHAHAFKMMAGEASYLDTTNNHEAGLEALGLTI